MSILIFVVALAYGVTKFAKMSGRLDSTYQSYVEVANRDENNILNRTFAEMEFQFAVQVLDEFYNPPKGGIEGYVEVEAELVTLDVTGGGGSIQFTKTQIPHHLCDEEDIKKFYKMGAGYS